MDADKEHIIEKESEPEIIEQPQPIVDSKGQENEKIEHSVENTTPDKEDPLIDSSEMEHENVAAEVVQENTEMEISTCSALDAQTSKSAEFEKLTQRKEVIQIVSDVVLPKLTQETDGILPATDDKIDQGKLQKISDESLSRTNENIVHENMQMISDEYLPTTNEEIQQKYEKNAQEPVETVSDDALRTTNENIDQEMMPPAVISTPKLDEITSEAYLANVASASGLSLLAQYDSASDKDANDDDDDDDTDSVEEVPTQSNYRQQVVEIDSDDSSDSSDSDVEYLSEMRKKIDKRIQCDDDDSDDDDEDGNGGNKGKKRQPPKVKGELLLDDLPPIEDLHITVPEDECVELGSIHSIVDQLVLVNAKHNSVLVNLDTVLFLEKGQKVLGEVFDVLGQVADPLYCVRFNSNKQIQERNIKIGEIVYVAPKTKHTQFVILSSIMNMRGSDASWENDIEPPPRCLDYSDDEEERVARQRLRNKKRGASKDGEVVEINDDDDDNSSVYSAAESTVSSQPQNSRGRRQHNRSDRRPNQRNSNNYNHRSNYQHGDSWHSNFHPQMRHRAPFFPSRSQTTMSPATHFPRGHMPQMYNPYGSSPMPPTLMPTPPPQMHAPMMAQPMNAYPPQMYGYNSYGPPPHQHMPSHPNVYHEPPPPGE